MRALIALLLSLWLAPAWAQLPLTGAGKGAPGGATPFSITGTDHAEDSTGATTYTWSSKNFAIGAANATRYVGMTLVGRGIGLLGSASSVTVNGATSATFVGKRNTQVDGNSLVTEIWVVPVPTGTTMTISVVYPSSMLRAGIAVFSILGSNGSTPAGAAVSSAEGGSVASVNTAVTVPSGGGSLVVSANLNSATVTPTNYTEYIDAIIGSTTAYEAGSDTSNSGSTTYTATFSTTASGNIVAAAWSP